MLFCLRPPKQCDSLLFRDNLFPIDDTHTLLHCIATSAVEGVDGVLLFCAGFCRTDGSCARLSLPEVNGILEPAFSNSTSTETEAVGQTVVRMELSGDAEG